VALISDSAFCRFRVDDVARLRRRLLAADPPRFLCLASMPCSPVRGKRAHPPRNQLTPHLYADSARSKGDDNGLLKLILRREVDVEATTVLLVQDRVRLPTEAVKLGERDLDGILG
jgi:hypothetical protein